jgi:L,D-transpeptidase catalytic domain
MKFIMRLFFTTIFICAGISALAYFFWYKPKFAKTPAVKNLSEKKTETSAIVKQRMQSHALTIKNYAKTHGCNTWYCFLVDMNIESGKNRFFVYNLKNDSAELSGLVTHGSGKASSSEIRFSNQEGSLCSSLGKYKIGNSYSGKFGLAYKLYGLDSSNSNAFNRFVVLHSHECVPNEETTPFPICESWGCPTVAPSFLTALTKYIDKADKPILLSIYN